MYDVCKSELATNRFRDGQMETQEGRLGQDLELGSKSGKGMNEYQGHIAVVKQTTSSSRLENTASASFSRNMPAIIISQEVHRHNEHTYHGLKRR